MSIHTVDHRTGRSRGSLVVRTTTRSIFLAVVVLGFLLGPPAIPSQVVAAANECRLDSGNNRDFRLRWRTVTWDKPTFPHWACTDLSSNRRSTTNLGYWILD